jgi:hypothetical protein
MQNQPKVLEKINIEELIVKRDIISSEAIKNAMKTLKETNQKIEEEKILTQLKEIDYIISKAVDSLRTVRKREKATKNLLIEIVQAQFEYYKTGNYQAFLKAYKKANDTFHYAYQQVV